MYSHSWFGGNNLSNATSVLQHLYVLYVYLEHCQDGLWRRTQQYYHFYLTFPLFSMHEFACICHTSSLHVCLCEFSWKDHKVEGHLCLYSIMQSHFMQLRTNTISSCWGRHSRSIRSCCKRKMCRSVEFVGAHSRLQSGCWIEKKSSLFMHFLTLNKA